jgi:hypothetical protein
MWTVFCFTLLFSYCACWRFIRIVINIDDWIWIGLWRYGMFPFRNRREGDMRADQFSKFSPRAVIWNEQTSPNWRLMWRLAYYGDNTICECLSSHLHDDKTYLNYLWPCALLVNFRCIRLQMNWLKFRSPVSSYRCSGGIRCLYLQDTLLFLMNLKAC